jgi:hypothetical protein
MSISDPGTVRAEPLVARVKSILMSPQTEWTIIEAEPTTPRRLFGGYVVILAAVPAIARFIGNELFGHNFYGIVYKPPLVTALVSMIITYVLALVTWLLIGLAVNALAPSFDGQTNRTQALKLAAYSGTAGWIAGILHVYPPLDSLVLLGSIYGLYLIYLGLPKLMKAPQQKTLGYTVVTIIVAAVLSLFVSVVASGAALIGPDLTQSTPGGTLTGNLQVPGGSVDTAKLAAASAAMQATAQQMQAQAGGHPMNGVLKAIAPDALKALLPDNLSSGFTRTELSSQSEAAGSLAGSQATGIYTKGESRITLEVSDLAAASALASLGGAFNVESSRQTATGYEKVGKVDGRLTTESFDQQAKSGKYSVIVADRFVVEANGSGVAMDDLKGAVSSVGFDRLAGMARG